jgi:hypothetical protein
LSDIKRHRRRRLIEIRPSRWNRHKPTPRKPMEKPFKGLASAEAKCILGQVNPNATPNIAVHPLRLVLGKFLADFGPA